MSHGHWRGDRDGHRPGETRARLRAALTRRLHTVTGTPPTLADLAAHTACVRAGGHYRAAADTPCRACHAPGHHTEETDDD